MHLGAAQQLHQPGHRLERARLERGVLSLGVLLVALVLGVRAGDRLEGAARLARERHGRHLRGVRLEHRDHRAEDARLHAHFGALRRPHRLRLQQVEHRVPTLALLLRLARRVVLVRGGASLAERSDRATGLRRDRRVRRVARHRLHDRERCGLQVSQRQRRRPILPQAPQLVACGLGNARVGLAVLAHRLDRLEQAHVGEVNPPARRRHRPVRCESRSLVVLLARLRLSSSGGSGRLVLAGRAAARRAELRRLRARSAKSSRLRPRIPKLRRLARCAAHGARGLQRVCTPLRAKFVLQVFV